MYVLLARIFFVFNERRRHGQTATDQAVVLTALRWIAAAADIFLMQYTDSSALTEP